MSNHALGNILYSLGWSDQKINMALISYYTGTQSQRNKFFSEIAPQFRATWHSL